jgi:uncharacterized membrane protein YecN with MAPEG domain
MSMPTVVAVYAAVATVLVLVLAGRVAHYRVTRRIGIGDGNDSELARRIRAHGNAIENLPLGLLLLLLLELQRVPGAWLHLFGVTLLLGRVLHAYGLSRRSGASPGRLGGILLTWLVMLAMALTLLVRSLA